MREILFRGKRLKKYCKAEDWTEGVPFIDHEGDCILKTAYSEYVVDEKTVGQYTGLTDKNGKKIFEGDIVRYPDTTMFPSSEETINEGFVDWDEETMCFYFTNRFVVDMEDFYIDNGKMVDVVVIGNIHDNPELLKGGEG